MSHWERDLATKAFEHLKKIIWSHSINQSAKTSGRNLTKNWTWFLSTSCVIFLPLGTQWAMLGMLALSFCLGQRQPSSVRSYLCSSDSCWLFRCGLGLISSTKIFCSVEVCGCTRCSEKNPKQPLFWQQCWTKHLLPTHLLPYNCLWGHTVNAELIRIKNSLFIKVYF